MEQRHLNSGRFGLYTVEQDLIPLENSQVDVFIVESVAEVKITQKYLNQGGSVVEAFFTLPLDDNSAICEFEAELENKKIIGVVKNNRDAKTIESELGLKSESSQTIDLGVPGLFKAKIGKVKSETFVTINLKYVVELVCEGGKAKIILPKGLAPSHSGSTPGVSPALASPFAPGRLSVNLNCLSGKGILSIESPTHPITTNLKGYNALAALDRSITSLNSDIVFLIQYTQPQDPVVYIEEAEKGNYVALLNFQPVLPPSPEKTELIFMIPRVSLIESRITELRECLTFTMRSLPIDCYINFVEYGSATFVPLFQSSRKLSVESFNLVLNHIESIKADMGSESGQLEPLFQFIAQKPEIPNYLRQVFLLAIGDISDSDKVISLVQSNIWKSRIFALGIGNAVNKCMLEGIAKLSQGTLPVVQADERLDKKLLKQLKEALEPTLQNVQIDWGVLNQATSVASLSGSPKGSPVMARKSVHRVGSQADIRQIESRQAPYVLEPFRGNQFLRIYYLFYGKEHPKLVYFTATTPAGTIKIEIPIEISKVIQGNLLHTLAARRILKDISNNMSPLHSTGIPTPKAIEDEMILVAKKYNLASQATSFLAVDEKKLKDDRYLVDKGGNERASSPPPFSSSKPKRKSSKIFNPFSSLSKAFFKGNSSGSSSITTDTFSNSDPATSSPLSPLTFPAPLVGDSESNIASSAASGSSPILASGIAQASPRSNLDILLGTIIQFQNFNGSFQWSQELADLLEISYPKAEEGLSSTSGLPEISDPVILKNVWGTLIMIGYFNLKLADLRDQWDLVEKKARNWLKTFVWTDFEAVLATASSLIR